MKKICIILLMLCLCFTGCASKTNPPSETDTETRAEETTGKQIDENKFSLIGSDGKAAYRIIYPENASALLLEAAGNLRMSLYQSSGKSLIFPGIPRRRRME